MNRAEEDALWHSTRSFYTFCLARELGTGELELECGVGQHSNQAQRSSEWRDTDAEFEREHSRAMYKHFRAECYTRSIHLCGELESIYSKTKTLGDSDLQSMYLREKLRLCNIHE
uniref:Uncharacterized protein n=1 Tax=Lygus hesperus TaxID=30085 RepID=A0A146LX42_LYGHE